MKSPVLCSFCDLACYSIGDILQHHSENHESETPPYFQCNDCDFCHKKKFFVEKHSMKTHGKHFMCRKCKKRLGKTETYEEHLIKSELCKIALEKLGPEDSACEICNFRCSSSAELKVRKSQKEILVSSISKKKTNDFPLFSALDYKKVVESKD